MNARPPNERPPWDDPIPRSIRRHQRKVGRRASGSYQAAHRRAAQAEVRAKYPPRCGPPAPGCHCSAWSRVNERRELRRRRQLTGHWNPEYRRPHRNWPRIHPSDWIEVPSGCQIWMRQRRPLTGEPTIAHRPAAVLSLLQATAVIPPFPERNFRKGEIHQDPYGQEFPSDQQIEITRSCGEILCINPAHLQARWQGIPVTPVQRDTEFKLTAPTPGSQIQVELYDQPGDAQAIPRHGLETRDQRLRPLLAYSRLEAVEQKGKCWIQCSGQVKGWVGISANPDGDLRARMIKVFHCEVSKCRLQWEGQPPASRIPYPKPD